MDMENRGEVLNFQGEKVLQGNFKNSYLREKMQKRKRDKNISIYIKKVKDTIQKTR